MQPLNTFGEAVGQNVGRYAETAPGESRIVDIRLDYGALRIHAQTRRHAAVGMRGVERLDIGTEPLPLAHGIEGDVAAPLKIPADGRRRIRRAIGMYAAVQLLHSELKLVERGSGAFHSVFAENRESAPEGVGFERHDNLRARPTGYIGNQVEIATQTILVDHIEGCRQSVYTGVTAYIIVHTEILFIRILQYGNVHT